MNPEQEFNQAAVDACRSTIIQQEADIKSLKENLELRNKKIMQLDGQVGVAKSYLSSRDTAQPENVPVQMSSLLNTLNLLVIKLGALSDNFLAKPQAVNVYNSTCNTQKHSVASTASQTAFEPSPAPLPTISTNSAESIHAEVTNARTHPVDTSESSETILTCTICNENFQCTTHLDEHMENAHDNQSSTTIPTEGNSNHVGSVCDYCSDTFTNPTLLQDHVSTKHASDYISCDFCKLRFQNSQRLNVHVKAYHEPLPQTQLAPVETGGTPMTVASPSDESSATSRPSKL